MPSETERFYQEVISFQQGRLHLAPQDLWTAKNLVRIKKCSQQPHDVSSSGWQSGRNISEMQFCYPSYLLTSGCIVCIHGEECKCIITQPIALARGQSEGSGEKWA